MNRIRNHFSPFYFCISTNPLFSVCRRNGTKAFLRLSVWEFLIGCRPACRQGSASVSRLKLCLVEGLKEANLPVRDPAQQLMRGVVMCTVCVCICACPFCSVTTLVCVSHTAVKGLSCRHLWAVKMGIDNWLLVLTGCCDLPVELQTYALAQMRRNLPERTRWPLTSLLNRMTPTLTAGTTHLVPSQPDPFETSPYTVLPTCYGTHICWPSTFKYC